MVLILDDCSMDQVISIRPDYLLHSPNGPQFVRLVLLLLEIDKISHPQVLVGVVPLRLEHNLRHHGVSPHNEPRLVQLLHLVKQLPRALGQPDRTLDLSLILVAHLQHVRTNDLQHLSVVLIPTIGVAYWETVVGILNNLAQGL